MTLEYPTKFTKNSGRKEEAQLELFSLTPFPRDFSNVLKFKDESQQNEFFHSKHVKLFKSFNEFQYIPATGDIFVDGTFTVLEWGNISYMRFKNWVTDKWLYAFIDSAVYINEGTIKINYELDPYQSFQFEIENPDNRIDGQMEYESDYKKRSFWDLQDQSFGMSYPTKKTAGLIALGLDEVEWLVIVAKPKIKIGDLMDSSYQIDKIGYQRQLRYFVVPVKIYDHKTIPYKIGDKEVPSFQLGELFKFISGWKDAEQAKSDGLLQDGAQTGSGNTAGGATRTVNNIVNIYFSRHIGLDYTSHYKDGKTVDKIELSGKGIDWVVHEIGEKGAGSSGGAGSPGGSAEIKGKYKYDPNNKESRIRAITAIIRDSVPGSTPNGIIGAIGCFGGESDCNPFRYEADYTNGNQYDKADSGGVTAENLFGGWGGFQGKYSIGLNEGAYRAGDGQHWIGLGLGQWTGPRSKACYDWIKSKGLSIWDLNGQIGFALAGEADSGTFIDCMKYTGDVASSVSNFLQHWERGGAWAGAERINFGNQWFNVVKDEFEHPTIKAEG